MTFGIWMSVELMVWAKGLFIAVIVSIALVLVSLVALILVSGWLLLWLAMVLMAGFRLSLGFLQLEFSIVLKKIINIFSCGVWGNVWIVPIQNTFLNGVEHVGIIEAMAMGSWE
jgi:hypothetical protein